MANCAIANASDQIQDDIIHRVRAAGNIRILENSYCFGLYEGNLLGVLQRDPHAAAAERLVHLRAGHAIVATGAYETPFLFPNNDLVCVMLSTGVLKLLHLYGVQAGKRAVVVGAPAPASEVSVELRSGGIEVVTVVHPDAVLRATGFEQGGWDSNANRKLLMRSDRDLRTTRAGYRADCSGRRKDRVERRRRSIPTYDFAPSRLRRRRRCR